MGCDIHVHTERRVTNGTTSRWVNNDNWKVNHRYDPTDTVGDQYYNQPFIRDTVYDGRNYELFSTLAGVRDRGTTAIIAEPRGIPEDASITTKEDFNRWEGGAHTPHYYTIKELLDAKKTMTAKEYTGLLDPQQALDLKKGITPNHWCQGSNDETLVRRTWTEEGTHLDGFLNKIVKHFKELSWEYEDCESKFYLHSDEMRVVFWFDS